MIGNRRSDGSYDFFNRDFFKAKCFCVDTVSASAVDMVAAGRARDFLNQGDAARGPGSKPVMAARTKDGYRGNVDDGSDVHWAGIITQEYTAFAQYSSQLGQ